MLDNIQGSGGGGGSQSSHAMESQDTLHNTSFMQILDLVSFGGEIYGFADKDNPLKCVYYNGTRVQNADGTFNFNNVIVDSRVGTQDQDYIRGFDGALSETGVGQELRVETPWVMEFTNLELSAIHIHVAVPALTKANTATGSIGGYSIAYAIDMAIDGGEYTQISTGVISGKTTSQYDRGHRVELPNTATVGWTLRVRRITPNADSASISDTLQMVSYTEIIDGKFRYPMSALVGHRIDAAQFPSVPTRGHHLKGMLINIPSNYDPETRTYTGVWDGTFVIAYSNNPAWVFYDYIVNNWFGLGKRVDPNFVDKWKLYAIGVYCDEMVSDGRGGTEPRFTCNHYAQTGKEAARFLMDLASVFRGIMYTAQGSIFASADMPQDVAYLYNQANVIDGKFRYSGSSRKVRHTVALVSYNDMNDLGRAKVIRVDDEDGIARYGIQKIEVTAVGCTSRGQAWRYGKMLLVTERYETDVCRWSVGLDGTIATPGMVVKVGDPNRAQRRIGGRIKTATLMGVTVDKLPVVEAGNTISVVLSTGVVEQRTVLSVDGATVNVAEAFSSVPAAQSAWIVESDSLAAQTFRVLAVTEEDEGKTYTLYGVQHVPGKYAYVEQGIALDEPPINPLPTNGQQAVVSPPANLTVSFHDVTTQNTTQKVATFSWDFSEGATGYAPFWRINSGEWQGGVTQVNNSVDITGVVPGIIEVSVKATNGFNGWSLAATAGPFDVVAVATPPGYVNDIQDVQAQHALDIIANAQAVVDEAAARASADADAAADTADAIAAAAADAAADATTKVNNAKAELQANIDVIQGQVADIYGADVWSSSTAYDDGELVQTGGSPSTLYRALQAVPAGTALTNTTYWESLGNYSSLGEAVAANLQLTTQNVNDIESISGVLTDYSSRFDDVEASVTDEVTARTNADTALSTRTSVMESRMPAGTGSLATSASVSSEATTRADADTAQSSRISTMEARMPAGSGSLATSASVTDEASARVSADGALSTRVGVMEARMPAGTGTLATNAQITTEQSARASGDSANATDIANINTRLNNATTGLDAKASITSVNTVTARLDNTGAGRSVEQVASALAAVESNVNDGTNGLATKASITSVSAITTRLNDVGGGKTVEQVATDVASLKLAVNDPTTGLGTKASITSVNTVQSNLDTTNSTVSAQGASLTQVKAGLTTALPQLPSTFEQGSLFFTNTRSGSPDTVPDQAGSIINDGEAGPAFLISNWTVAGNNILTKGTLKIESGRVYRLRVRFRVQDSADGSVQFTAIINGMDYAYANGATITSPSMTVTHTPGSVSAIQVMEAKYKVGGGAGYNSLPAGVLARAGLRLNTNETGLLVRIISLEWDDVTGEDSNAVAISSLSGTVTSQGDTITSQGTALTQVQASIGQSPDNLVLTSNFDDGTIGHWAAGTVSTTSYGGVTRKTLSGIISAGYVYENGGARWLDCQPGDVFDLSAKLRTCQLRVNFYDINKAFISGGTNALNSGPTGVNAVATTTVAPANAVFCRIAVRYPSELYPGESLSYGFDFRVYKRRPQEIANASASQALDVRVTSTEGKLTTIQAAYAMELDVDGKVVGIYGLNDGVTGSLVFDFDSIAFVSGTGGSYINGGIIKQAAGGYMTVSGPGFGASSDLVRWYGPEMAVTACTKANAIAYEDTSGHAFVQALTVGDIEFYNSSTSNAVPNTLSLAVTDTNGATKTLTATYSGSRHYISASSAPANGTATLSLWRKIGTGSFTQIGTGKTVTLTDTVSDYDGTRYTHDVSGGDSFTFTDTNTTTGQTFTYEWRLTARSITVQSQSMSLKSVE